MNPSVGSGLIFGSLHWESSYFGANKLGSSNKAWKSKVDGPKLHLHGLCPYRNSRDPQKDLLA